MSSIDPKLAAYCDAQRDAHIDELKSWIAIPSISADPDHRDDVRACCERLVARMGEIGMKASVLETAGNPLAYGEWLGAPGKPTVLIYGHYDVQPVDPIELWKSPPFEGTVRDGKIYGRGSVDDKGQVLMHVAAIDAHLRTRGSLPVNVKFLVEGEEEAGGQAIEEYVRQDGGRRLAADCVVISDSSLFAPGQPALVYGLKGLCYMEIKVTGPNRDLHSGTFGGAVWNPLNALCHIVDRLRDAETGKILIPRFYDDVRPLEAWEREEFAKLPWDEAAYRSELGVPRLFGEEGYTTRERTWARPTCDVNGIFGGYMGKGAKTVLPSWGGAKVSMRLVPDQDPKKIASLFTDYVHAVAPEGVTVEVTNLHGADPVVVEVKGPIVDAALDAMEEIWGARPVRIREGGSIPIVSTFASVLKCPVLLLGFGLNDDGLHSPNEKFNISHFYNGIRSVARMLDRLSSL